jgi:hypothetical protein
MIKRQSRVAISKSEIQNTTNIGVQGFRNFGIKEFRDWKKNET